MARFYYTLEQKRRIGDLLNSGDHYITIEAIKKFTGHFNEHYGTSQKYTAIAAQLRMIKQEMGSPVKIEWHLKTKKYLDNKSVVQPDAEARQFNIANPCQKVKHLIKALADGVAELVEENMQLKLQMRKMAGIRAAVEQYQKIG